MSRLIMRIVVVLPQPDGPTRTRVSPSATSKDRSPTAAADAFGNRLVTERKAIIGVSVIVGSEERMGSLVARPPSIFSSDPRRDHARRGRHIVRDMEHCDQA